MMTLHEGGDWMRFIPMSLDISRTVVSRWYRGRGVDVRRCGLNHSEILGWGFTLFVSPMLKLEFLMLSPGVRVVDVGVIWTTMQCRGFWWSFPEVRWVLWRVFSHYLSSGCKVLTWTTCSCRVLVKFPCRSIVWLRSEYCRYKDVHLCRSHDGLVLRWWLRAWRWYLCIGWRSVLLLQV